MRAKPPAYWNMCSVPTGEGSVHGMQSHFEHSQVPPLTNWTYFSQAFQMNEEETACSDRQKAQNLYRVAHINKASFQ